MTEVINKRIVDVLTGGMHPRRVFELVVAAMSTDRINHMLRNEGSFGGIYDIGELLDIRNDNSIICKALPFNVPSMDIDERKSLLGKVLYDTMIASIHESCLVTDTADLPPGPAMVFDVNRKASWKKCPCCSVKKFNWKHYYRITKLTKTPEHIGKYICHDCASDNLTLALWSNSCVFDTAALADISVPAFVRYYPPSLYEINEPYLDEGVYYHDIRNNFWRKHHRLKNNRDQITQHEFVTKTAIIPALADSFTHCGDTYYRYVNDECRKKVRTPCSYDVYKITLREYSILHAQVNGTASERHHNMYVGKRSKSTNNKGK